jgi:hypothetical protein
MIVCSCRRISTLDYKTEEELKARIMEYEFATVFVPM